MDISVASRKLIGLSKINVLLGKNGSGKSSLLRFLEENKSSLLNLGFSKYVTPERGGELTYAGNIETNIAQNPDWGDQVRRNNRFDQFRQMSVTEFRRLETLVLRKIEKDSKTRADLSFSFDTTMAMINGLLDNITIARSDGSGFEIRSKTSNESRSAATLSSGESELISLGIEILAFAYRAEVLKDKNCFLFLDEPDVHLHPDLQDRLAKLIVEVTKPQNVLIIIATHSTALLSALSAAEDAKVGFISTDQHEINFLSISDSLKSILPIFGAHPLSNVFGASPILLVEGEDDERVWQQAVRSAQGKLRLWPCQAGDVQSLDAYENQVDTISQAIYENAKAYSLRDRDDGPYEIDDKLIVIRMRLFCRSAENLIVTDDVLALLNTNWDTLRAKIDHWLEVFPYHPQNTEMAFFKETGYDRINANLKPVRNIIMALAGSQKPWEVAVGQAIARLTYENGIDSTHNLKTFLGTKAVLNLGLSC